MEKLEQYLDRICRHLGGPRSMRQHVRQELREHLLDAVAGHRAAGLAENAAIDKAISEFGQSDEVRTELEAAHGQQRMMAVVIDKALNWKENTMRAKWLWTTWALLASGIVIALEVLFITFMVMFIVPKFQKLMHDGMVDRAVLDEQHFGWIATFLNEVQYVTNHYMTFIMIAAAVLWGLFEWRIKSDHKAFIRLSAFGMIAIGLTSLIIVQAGSMLVAFGLTAPPLGCMAQPFAREQVAAVHTAVNALEQARTQKDWDGMSEQARLISEALNRLSVGPALQSLTTRDRPIDWMRQLLQIYDRDISVVRAGIQTKNEAELEAALQAFRKSFEPIREAAMQTSR
jgi:hypothetical protein